MEELNVDMTEHIQFVIDALKEKADELGLKRVVHNQLPIKDCVI